MDSIARFLGTQSVVAAQNVYGPGASYAVPGSTASAPGIAGPFRVAPGSPTVAPTSGFGSPEFLKNVSSFASAAGGVGGLVEGFATARNLKAIRKQESKILERDAKRAISRAAVNYRKGGVLAEEGTPIDILSQSADQAEMDQVWLKYRYRNLQTQARLSGATAGLAGAGDSVTTLLSKRGR